MVNDTPLVPCRKCGIPYPRTPEYFHKDAQNHDGLRHDCKECQRAAKRKFRNENIEAARARELRYNETHRDRRAEYARKWRKDNPDYDTNYRRGRKEIENKNNREWRAKNPEKVRQYRRNDRLRHSERIKHSLQEWTSKNRLKVREDSKRRYLRYRPKILLRQALDRQNNPEKYRQKARNRRHAPGRHTKADKLALYELQDGRCGYCGIPIFWDIKGDVHGDHMIPVTRGGSNNPDNICLSCRDCNLSKFNRTVTEWETVRGW